MGQGGYGKRVGGETDEEWNGMRIITKIKWKLKLKLKLQAQCGTGSVILGSRQRVNGLVCCKEWRLISKKSFTFHYLQTCSLAAALSHSLSLG